MMVVKYTMNQKLLTLPPSRNFFELLQGDDVSRREPQLLRILQVKMFQVLCISIALYTYAFSHELSHLVFDGLRDNLISHRLKNRIQEA